MRVDCPNCGTQYEVSEIHFSDGARKVRCTECGYRWNQSVTKAHFNEGRKDAPLLDMLEPALDMAGPKPTIKLAVYFEQRDTHKATGGSDKKVPLAVSILLGYHSL